MEELTCAGYESAWHSSATTVGDFAGNTRKILEAIAQATSLGVDLVTFPELAICGYPPEDLL